MNWIFPMMDQPLALSIGPRRRAIACPKPRWGVEAEDCAGNDARNTKHLAIDRKECLQCLDCQVDYYDSAVCPPLAARRRRLLRLDESPSAA